MGNSLASCAGGAQRKPPRRYKSLPAKPPGLSQPKPGRDSAEGEGEEVEVYETPIAATSAGATHAQPKDPLLEQLMRLKEDLVRPSGVAQPASSPAAAPAESSRKPPVYNRRFSCMTPSRRQAPALAEPLSEALAFAATVVEKPEEEADPELTNTLGCESSPTSQQPPSQPQLSSPQPNPSPRPESPEPLEVRICRSAPSTPPPVRTPLMSSAGARDSRARRTPPPKPPRYNNIRLPPPPPKPPRPTQFIFPPSPAIAAADKATKDSTDVGEDDSGPTSLTERRACPNSPDSLEEAKPAIEAHLAMPNSTPSASPPPPLSPAHSPISSPSETSPPISEPSPLLPAEPPLEGHHGYPQQQQQQQQQPPKEAARPTSKSVCNLAKMTTLSTVSDLENIGLDGHLATLRPTCFGSAMCHMDMAASIDFQSLPLTATAAPASAADASSGVLHVPLTSRSRAACRTLSRVLVQSLPTGDAFLDLCRGRGCLSESAAADLARSAPADNWTRRAERFVELFDWSETSLRKLALCLSAGDEAAPFYRQLAAILVFLADLFALLAARHLFTSDSRSRKRWGADTFLRGVGLIDGEAKEEAVEGLCRVQVLYMTNSDSLTAEDEAQQLLARDVARVNEADWLSANFTPALSVDLSGSGVNAWFFKQLVGKSLETVAELSLAGCELDCGLLPTLVLTQRTSRLRVLCLAGATLGDESLSTLCLLPQQQLAGLQVLDVSACGLSHFGLALLANSLTLPSLAELDLSWNDLSEAAPSVMATLVSRGGLRGLRLRGCRLASDALRAIVDGIGFSGGGGGVSAGNRLRAIDLSDNRLNCLILARLAERLSRRGGWGGSSQQLSELGLAGVGLFATDLQKLLDSGGCGGCRRLDLSRNHLGEAGGLALAAKLPPLLEVLAVVSCRLGCRGLRRLVDAAASADRLRLLRAANNLRKGGGSVGSSGAEDELRREVESLNTAGRLRILLDSGGCDDRRRDDDFKRSVGDNNGGGSGSGGGGGLGGGLRRSLRRLASIGD